MIVTVELVIQSTLRYIDFGEGGCLMIISAFERGLLDDWSRYAGSKIAADMLFELRKETKITNGFGVIWNTELPEWAERAQHGDFQKVKFLNRKRMAEAV